MARVFGSVGDFVYRQRQIITSEFMAARTTASRSVFFEHRLTVARGEIIEQHLS
jgi:hypothetical protein